jgi:hypothetical protein
MSLGVYLKTATTKWVCLPKRCENVYDAPIQQSPVMHE